MGNYIEKALFIYADQGSGFIKPMLNNSLGTQVIDMDLDDFLHDPLTPLETVNHVVVSGPLAAIKTIMELAATHGFSMGIIPLSRQKRADAVL